MIDASRYTHGSSAMDPSSGLTGLRVNRIDDGCIVVSTTLGPVLIFHDGERLVVSTRRHAGLTIGRGVYFALARFDLVEGVARRLQSTAFPLELEGRPTPRKLPQDIREDEETRAVAALASILEIVADRHASDLDGVVCDLARIRIQDRSLSAIDLGSAQARRMWREWPDR